MINTNISSLIKNYVIWPELTNDGQKKIDFSNTKISDFSQEIASLDKKRKSIDNDIALFYMANENLSKARQFSQDVLGLSELSDYEFYQKIMNKVSKSLLAYITVCSLVEVRHCRSFSMPSFSDWMGELQENKEDLKAWSNFYNLSMSKKISSIQSHSMGNDFLQNKYELYYKHFDDEEQFAKFLIFFAEVGTNLAKQFKKKSRNHGYQNIAENYLKDNLANYTLGEVLSYVNIIFKVGDFKHGFGGALWAQICNHGLDFVQGKVNAEMFIDKSFALEHNNGSMFNKDYLFNLPSSFYIGVGFDTNYNYSGYYISTDINEVLLNAQHLGMISGLFKLESSYKSFMKLSIEDLFTKYTNDNPKIKTNMTEFTKHHELIKDSYEALIPPLRKIKNEISNFHPELLNESNEKFNLTTIIREMIIRQDNTINEQLQAVENNLPTSSVFNFHIWDYINRPKPLKKVKLAKNNSKFEIYDIDQLPINKFDKEIVGGKAWGLANMHKLHLPVPKAKVFTTDCCSLYHTNINKFNMGLHKILPQFGDYLKDDNGKPILCSVRSGAPISMPGMMDTVLNVGIDDTNYDYFCKKMGKKVVNNCINKFIELFCSANLNISINLSKQVKTNLAKFKEVLVENNIDCSNGGIFPLSQIKQIEYSLHGVFKSWHSERAVAFRNEKNIDHNLGTAAIIQQMVFGNLNENSCTGVVFSRDCLTGENKLVGEFLPKAQGEDVVSGSVTPFDISHLKSFNKEIYNQLESIAKKLEGQTGQIQDIEFTVEDNKLYILQHRQAVCSPVAAVKLLEDKNLDKTALVSQIEPKTLQESVAVVTDLVPCASGLSANSGAISGMIINQESDMRLYEDAYLQHKKFNPNFGWIFYSELTSPEHMPLMNKTDAFITEQGGFTSHAAIIARSLNKPCVVGLGDDKNKYFVAGATVTVDATNGKIWLGEQPLVENTELAKSAAKLLMLSHNIDEKTLQDTDFKQHVDTINEKNRSWLFNFPQAKYVEKKILKKEIFLGLGQKMALILSANNRDQKRLKIAA